MTHSKYLAGAAALALVAAACSGGSSPEAAITTIPTVASTTAAVAETTTTTITSATTTSTIPVPSTTLAPDVPRLPLTGMFAESEGGVTNRPALAVKIDNAPAARRNHSGIAVADVVFEEKVEGGLTRFAVVFHSQDADPVGPIRSGREQDVNLLSSLNLIPCRRRRTFKLRQLLPRPGKRPAQPVLRHRVALRVGAGR